MRLDRIIRKGVALADRITKSLQGDVIHYHWSGDDQADQDATGDKTFPAPVTRKAVITLKQQFIRTSAGEDAVSHAQVTFLSPVDVHMQDQIILPDGTTGPILNIAGPVDPSTGKVYAVDVWLGNQQR